MPHKVKVMEELQDNKFLVQIGDGKREEILTYNEIIEYVDNALNPEEQDQAFGFQGIIDHRTNPCRKMEVLVFWDTEEET